MPGSGGLSDFLDLHANVFRRVRNLETGVHPTRTEGGADVYPPTALTILGGTPWHAGSAEPGWQRRAGFVQLFGRIETSSPTGWGSLDEYHIANLPPEARPGRDTGYMLVAGSFTSPPFGFIRAQADGGLYVAPPDGATASQVWLYLQGPCWSVE